MNNYLVTLTPLDWFFFGGEQTHGEGDSSQYFSKSNYLPQQSALLGMLRYQLLKQKGWLTKDKKNDESDKNKKPAPSKEEIEALIGKKSFSMQERLFGPASFGVIQKISPIGIKENQDKNPDQDKEKDGFYLPVPLTDGYKIKFEENKSRVYLAGECKKIRIDDAGSFNPKKNQNDEIWCRREDGKKIQSSDIWKESEKIGITKTTGQKDNDDAFYKQEFLSFKKKYVYAFYCSLDDKAPELKNDNVYLGGQRSAFYMSVEPVEGTVEELFLQHVKEKKDENQIVLLSDSYVEDMEALNKATLFHWSDSLPFRNIETKVGQEKYHRKLDKIEVKYHFIKRGSVLFCKGKEKQEELKKLLNNDYLQAIGYNYFI